MFVNFWETFGPVQFLEVHQNNKKKLWLGFWECDDRKIHILKYSTQEIFEEFQLAKPWRKKFFWFTPPWITSPPLPFAQCRQSWRSWNFRWQVVAVSIFSDGQRDCSKDMRNSTKPASCSSPVVRTARCRRWGRWEGWLGLLRGVLVQLVLKGDAHLKHWLMSSVADHCCHPCPHHHHTIIVNNLGDDDVLRDVSLLHKLPLSARASTLPCFLILVWFSYNMSNILIWHDNPPSSSCHLWFADVLTAVVDRGQDDRNHWRLTRLRWTACSSIIIFIIWLDKDWRLDENFILLSRSIFDISQIKSRCYSFTLTTFEGWGWELISRWSRCKKHWSTGQTSIKHITYHQIMLIKYWASPYTGCFFH